MITACANWRLSVMTLVLCVAIWIPPLHAADEKPALKNVSLRARLEAHLLDVNGKSLMHQVKVHLYNTQGLVERAGQVTQSDAHGVVTFRQLPAGQYDLWLESAAPHQPVRTKITDEVPASVFHGLNVTAGADTQTIELKLSATGAIQGHVQMADGKTPAPGCTIAIQSATHQMDKQAAAFAQGARDCYAETKVGPEGAFVLHGLTPGTQQLDIRKPGQTDPWFTIPVVPVRTDETMSIGTWAMPKNGWQMMFDGKTLKNWKLTEFDGHSEARVENGQIILPQGHDMTGVTYTGEVPHLDYEVSLEAMRVEGHDFFCGLTFPVEKDPCSLILGGWGGTVVGLSNVDGFDASENVTTRTMDFDSNKWYRVRLRVTKAKIEAWIDNEKLVDLDRTDKKFSIRMEVEASQPFGIATWRTTGAIRDIRIRRLDSPTAP